MSLLIRLALQKGSHNAPITQIEFERANGNLLFSSSKDGTLNLWDLRDPKLPAVVYKSKFSETPMRIPFMLKFYFDSLSVSFVLTLRLTYCRLLGPKSQPITCFSINSDVSLMAGGTDLTGEDAAIVFW